MRSLIHQCNRQVGACNSRGHRLGSIS
jgi:hypothetical protein